MNTDSPEFTEILVKVPRWHMLSPGGTTQTYDQKHVIKNNEDDWLVTKVSRLVGKRESYRREIPDNVRRSMAFWALHDKLAIVEPQFVGWRYGLTVGKFIAISYCGDSSRGFDSCESAEQAVPILNGESEIVKNLQEGPCAYMKWIIGDAV